MATYKAEFLAPPLRRAAAAPPRTTRWAGCPAGCAWSAAPAAPRRSTAPPGSAPGRPGQTPRRHRAGTRHPGARPAQSFQAWFARRGPGPRSGGRRRACCCGPTPSPTTWNPASAAPPSTALEALGYQRRGPGPARCCCGLTWISTGQLDHAKRVMTRTLATLQPWLDDGVPIVGLEPSCTAALKSEATELLPGHPGRHAGQRGRPLAGRDPPPARRGMPCAPAPQDAGLPSSKRRREQAAPRARAARRAVAAPSGPPGSSRRTAGGRRGRRWSRCTATSTPTSASTPTAR